MELFCDTSLPEMPTTVFGLLALVVVVGLLGIGWTGKVLVNKLVWAVDRLLGENGLIETQNRNTASNADAIKAVAACVKQHDERAASRHDTHHTECNETLAMTHRMFNGAIEACHVAERACRERNMDHEAEEVARIRLELQQPRGN